ncbi:ATP-binding protein [Bradyrhizobium sp. HKCCYLS2038]|uniref:ATP-binding protein n=1 Tax=unclassified Bradyrhizobium TaxID=2631580 RepID=UPI003EBA558F
MPEKFKHGNDWKRFSGFRSECRACARPVRYWGTRVQKQSRTFVRKFPRPRLLVNPSFTPRTLASFSTIARIPETCSVQEMNSSSPAVNSASATPQLDPSHETAVAKSGPAGSSTNRRMLLNAIARATPLSIVSSLINTTVVLASFHAVVDWNLLLLWSAFSYGLGLWLLARWFSKQRRAKRTAAEPRRPRKPQSLHKNIVMGAIMAAPWGILGFWLFGDLPQDQEMVLIALAVGMSAGGSVLLSAAYPAAITYMAVVLGPIVIKCFTIAGGSYVILGFLALSYAFFLLVNVGTYAKLFAERGEAMNRLGNSLAAAEEASRAKSDFLAMMSHEIRTPLAGMMGMIDLLVGTELNEEQCGLAHVAHESARNLLTVVNNILDFSKLEAGQFEPESIPFSVRHSIDAVRLLLAPKARSKGLQFETSISKDIPDQLAGDPSRLGQILLNLVGNSIKFTETGSIRITAQPRVLTPESIELRIEVIDTGTGIPADVQKGLFNAFVQADSSISRKYGGSGLGLAICKRLCQAMGGDIGVESEPGQGSKFWFTMVCRPCETPVKVQSPPIVPAIPRETSDLKILVAEDNDIIRSLVSKLLARDGYRADLVCNGREAVEAVQRKAYDLVLMDMQMPEMDGITASRNIRALDGPARNVPIIALTANALVGQREICLAAGMNDFVTKPIRPEALQAAIAQHRPAASGGSGKTAVVAGA